MRIESTTSTPEPKEESKKEKKPRKKRRKWLKWLIILFIVFGIPTLLLGASGIFNIPVISHIFGANSPRNLGIVVSEEALKSGLKKFPIELKSEPGTFTGLGNKEFEGEISVDSEYTSEEVTSVIDNLFSNAPHVSNIQVKYIEGGMEVSAFVETYLNAPVYAKVGVEKVTNKSIDVNIEKIKIGIVPIPEKYYEDVGKAIEDIVNGRMEKVDKFSIEELEYHDGYSRLKGTIPGSIKMLAGEQEL